MLEQGQAGAEAKGKAEALRRTAINMKSMGIETADIAKCTGLSAGEIESL